MRSGKRKKRKDKTHSCSCCSPNKRRIESCIVLWLGIMIAVAAPLILHSCPTTSSRSCSSSAKLCRYDNSVLRLLNHLRPPYPYDEAAASPITRFRCSVSSSAESLSSLPVREIKERCKTWQWRGYTINYLACSPAPPAADTLLPLLLVHGFGASVAHWRRNITTLSQYHVVYAVDLLGFGASDKPIGFSYSTEVWAQLILDFVEEIVQRPTVLIGNSVGSLACLIAAADTRGSLIRGLVLLNCAGGMNNKAIVNDWRIKLLLPLLWFFDFLLQQKGIASSIFDRVKQKANIRNILMSIYGNKESVDEELVEIIREPANDDGALDAFVSIVTGPPGPNPEQLIPDITVPLLVLWGNQDPFTPLDGPVGKYFLSLKDQLPNVNLFVLDGVGHCPHDDKPELVHSMLLPWLQHLSTGMR